MFALSHTWKAECDVTVPSVSASMGSAPAAFGITHPAPDFNHVAMQKNTVAAVKLPLWLQATIFGHYWEPIGQVAVTSRFGRAKPISGSAYRLNVVYPFRRLASTRTRDSAMRASEAVQRLASSVALTAESLNVLDNSLSQRSHSFAHQRGC